MKTFDMHNRVRETLRSYTTYVIPSGDNSEVKIEEREGLYYEPLSELIFKDAPNYHDVTVEELESYVSEFYTEVLSKLDPEDMACKLKFSCLTSNERTDSLAKRHVFAEWLKLYTDIEVKEIGTGENSSIIELDTPEFIGPMLEKVIREKIVDMRGFHSLRALYLFEKGEKIEADAKKLEMSGDISYYDYMQEACFLRCDADKIEDEYREKNKVNGYVKKYPGLKG